MAMRIKYVKSNGEIGSETEVDWSDYGGTILVSAIITVIILSALEVSSGTAIDIRFVNIISKTIVGVNHVLCLIKIIISVICIYFYGRKINIFQNKDFFKNPFRIDRGIYYLGIALLGGAFILLWLSTLLPKDYYCIRNVSQIFILGFCLMIIIAILIDFTRQGYLTYVQLVRRNEIETQLTTITSILIPIISFVLGYLINR